MAVNISMHKHTPQWDFAQHWLKAKKDRISEALTNKSLDTEVKKQLETARHNAVNEIQQGKIIANNVDKNAIARERLEHDKEIQLGKIDGEKTISLKQVEFDYDIRTKGLGLRKKTFDLDVQKQNFVEGALFEHEKGIDIRGITNEETKTALLKIGQDASIAAQVKAGKLDTKKFNFHKTQSDRVYNQNVLEFGQEHALAVKRHKDTNWLEGQKVAQYKWHSEQEIGIKKAELIEAALNGNTSRLLTLSQIQGFNLKSMSEAVNLLSNGVTPEAIAGDDEVYLEQLNKIVESERFKNGQIIADVNDALTISVKNTQVTEANNVAEAQAFVMSDGLPPKKPNLVEGWTRFGWNETETSRAFGTYLGKTEAILDNLMSKPPKYIEALKGSEQVYKMYTDLMSVKNMIVENQGAFERMWVDTRHEGKGYEAYIKQIDDQVKYLMRLNPSIQPPSE